MSKRRQTREKSPFLGGPGRSPQLINPRARWITLLQQILPVASLIAVSLAAYANAWPDVAVHDDRFFAGNERFPPWTDLGRIFSEDLWAAAGIQSGLYRPMLTLSLALDAEIYGDWLAGYHLTNIMLHALAAVLVYGLVNQLLRTVEGRSASSTRIYALLAALVFAVHPIHSETVNSIYNRSEVLVAIGGAAGLWWMLRNFDSRPFRAWAGLGLAYLFALFSKESAIVIPGIAVILIYG
jgi:hypothetical protein